MTTQNYDININTFYIGYFFEPPSCYQVKCSYYAFCL